MNPVTHLDCHRSGNLLLLLRLRPKRRAARQRLCVRHHVDESLPTIVAVSQMPDVGPGPMLARTNVAAVILVPAQGGISVEVIIVEGDFVGIACNTSTSTGRRGGRGPGSRWGWGSGCRGRCECGVLGVGSDGGGGGVGDVQQGTQARRLGVQQRACGERDKQGVRKGVGRSDAEVKQQGRGAREEEGVAQGNDIPMRAYDLLPGTYGGTVRTKSAGSMSDDPRLC